MFAYNKMEETTKKINIGPNSPEIGLPAPVLAKYQENDEDISFRSDDESHASRSTLSSVPLSISVASYQRERVHAPPPPSPPPSLPRSTATDESLARCQCVRQIQQAIATRGREMDDDTATLASDLDSNAFYWKPSPPIMRKEYSLALDRAMEKQCPRLLQLLQDMHIEDDAVHVAVKELVTSNDKVSAILKRMHESMTPKEATKVKPHATADTHPSSSTSTSTSVPTPFLDLIQPAIQGADIKNLKKLSANATEGYLWRDNALWTYPLAGMEDLVADVQQAKTSALQRLLEPFATKYDDAYTSLRKILRDVVTSGDYQLPPRTNVKSEDGEPVAQPMFIAQTPAQWIGTHLPPTTRFNVQSFLRDARLGFWHHEPQYFLDIGKARPLLESLEQFITAYEQDMDAVKHFTFNLKKNDDLLHRFHQTNENYDLMVVVHKLGVLFSKQCILLRLWVNAHLPNLAMWLSVIEKIEVLNEKRIVSPFFPPTSKRKLFYQLTDLGIFDSDVMDLVESIHYLHSADDASISASAAASDDDCATDDDDDDRTPPPRSTTHRTHPNADHVLRFSSIFSDMFKK